MILNSIGGSPKISWTRHSIEKMKYYRLSEGRVKRVLRHPHRTEEGVAPGTIASMQQTDSKKHPTEIWLMYLNYKNKGEDAIRIITAWRYPGISPKGKAIPIPESILQDLEKIL